MEEVLNMETMVLKKDLVLEIQTFLINLMSCRDFLENLTFVVILKCPKRMLEYYFSKGFTILECNDNNLENF